MLAKGLAYLTYISHYIQSHTLTIHFADPKALYLVIQPIAGLGSCIYHFFPYISYMAIHI